MFFFMNNWVATALLAMVISLVIVYPLAKLGNRYFDKKGYGKLADSVIVVLSVAIAILLGVLVATIATM